MRVTCALAAASLGTIVAEHWGCRIVTSLIADEDVATKLLEQGDPGKLNKLADAAAKPGGREKFLEVYINSLLRGRRRTPSASCRWGWELRRWHRKTRPGYDPLAALKPKR